MIHSNKYYKVIDFLFNRVLPFAWYSFVALFVLDALVNLDLATIQWQYGWEKFNAGRIFHRWLNAESLILFPNPPER